MATSWQPTKYALPVERDSLDTATLSLNAPNAGSTRLEGVTSAATRVFLTNARSADLWDLEVLKWEQSSQHTIFSPRAPMWI